MKIKYLDHLPSNLEYQAVNLYLNALEEKFAPVLGRDDRAAKILKVGISNKNCVSAVHGETLVGILGIQSIKGGFINPRLRTLIKNYGYWSGIYRMSGLLLLHHTAERDELYVDGVAVKDDMRGQGVGSGLFQMIEFGGRQQGYKKITLDVINTNKKARMLYQRLGFVETIYEKIWPMNLFFRFPFKSSIQMVKMLS